MLKLKQMTASALIGFLALSQIGCSNSNTAANILIGVGGSADIIAVACAAPTSNCSPALVAWVTFVGTQASADAKTVNAGTATVAEIQAVLTNLSAAVAQGNSIPGLTPTQSVQVATVIVAINSAIALVQALLATAPATGASVTVKGVTGIVTRGDTVMTFQRPDFLTRRKLSSKAAAWTKHLTAVSAKAVK